MHVSPFRLLLIPAVLALAGTVPASALAQAAPSARHAADKVLPVAAARPEDVSSMDAIMKAVYDVISGPKGQQRDWARMRSLFVPGARLIPARTGKDGVTGTRMLSVDDYIRVGGPYLE